MGAKLESIAFRWEGVTILLSSNGVLFTYTTFGTDLEASNFFGRIIDILKSINVII